MADATALRLGVAGLGRAFSVMLPTFTRHPAVRLVAAADTRTEARKRFGDEFSAKAYDTVAALCADAAVDAVYVATPHQFHREQATQAAGAGKHLLIEKPMALTVEDCTAIVEAARRAGVHVVVGHSHSFDAPVQHLRKLSVRAVTGSWDVTRPTEGAYATLLTFANGAFASLVYSGYGGFDSDEFEGWIGEMGQTKTPYAAQSRPQFKTQGEETAYKR